MPRGRGAADLASGSTSTVTEKSPHLAQRAIEPRTGTGVRVTTSVVGAVARTVAECDPVRVGDGRVSAVARVFRVITVVYVV